MALGAPLGLHIRLGPGGRLVKTPIAPGLIRSLPVAACRTIEPDEETPLTGTPAAIALYGERELFVPAVSISRRSSASSPNQVQICSLI